MRAWRRGSRWAWCAACIRQRPRAAGRHYGGFWIRFLARVIDGILLGVINAIVRHSTHADVRHRDDGRMRGLGRGSGAGLIFATGDDGRAGHVGADRDGARRGL